MLISTRGETLEMSATETAFLPAARILVVDDEWKMRDSLARGLGRAEKWRVEVAATGKEALYQLAKAPYDLLILDWMLPDHDGLEILCHIRDKGMDSSVIMLTARDGVDDCVSGLETGADDYLAKPFAFEELLARCRAILRSRHFRSTGTLRCGDLEFEPRARMVKRRGIEVLLTPLEADLLEYLLQRPQTLVTHDMLAHEVWRCPLDTKLMNSIYIHITRLRQKVDSDLGHTLIHTVPGRGYRLGVPLQ
jgi:DNA-binding response OmpR family regulator